MIRVPTIGSLSIRTDPPSDDGSLAHVGDALVLGRPVAGGDEADAVVRRRPGGSSRRPPPSWTSARVAFEWRVTLLSASRAMWISCVVVSSSRSRTDVRGVVGLELQVDQRRQARRPDERGEAADEVVARRQRSAAGPG